MCVIRVFRRLGSYVYAPVFCRGYTCMYIYFVEAMCHRRILRTFTECYMTTCALTSVVLHLATLGNDICVRNIIKKYIIKTI